MGALLAELVHMRLVLRGELADLTHALLELLLESYLLGALLVSRHLRRSG